MNVLIACEESQAICKEIRANGHCAFSCDLQSCSGGHPEWHIKGDCLPLLNGDCKFTTEDGKSWYLPRQWDLIIAHPPCTDLAVSGAAWFDRKRENGSQRSSIEFFCKFLDIKCDKVAIENPVGIIGGGDYLVKYFPDLAEKYHLPVKPGCYIQPYEHGDPARKKTCLWLKGLDPIRPTRIVEPKLVSYVKKDGSVTTYSAEFCYGFKREDRSRVSSKTYPGIAKAIADQWAPPEF